MRTNRISRRELFRRARLPLLGAIAVAIAACRSRVSSPLAEDTPAAGSSAATASALLPSIAATKTFWRRWFGPADAPGKVQWDGNLETLGSSAPDVSTVTLGANGTADAAVSTTTGPPGTLTDTRQTWATDYYVGRVVICNGKTITIAHNTARVLTGTAGWSGGGNPGNGYAYGTNEQYIEDGAWASDVNMAYFACRTDAAPPWNLIRFDPATNTYTAYTSAIGPSGYLGAMALCITGGKVYVAHHKAGSTNLCVSIFDTRSSPPTLVGSVHEYAIAEAAEAIATDGTYLFVGGQFGEIYVYLLSTMEWTATTVLSHPGLVHSLYYDEVSGCLFAGSQASHYVTKLHMIGASLHEDAALDYTTGGGYMASNNMAVANGSLWIPFESPIPGGLLGRVPVTAFDACTLYACGQTGQGGNSGIAVDPDGVTLWVTSFIEGFEGASYQRIVSKFNTNDFTYQRIWLPDETVCPGDIVQYAAGKFLIPTWTNPAKVINLTLPESGIKPPDSGSNYSYWASLRAYVESTPDASVGSLLAYTDGANGLGTGWTAVGSRATGYTEPTGTEGVSGDQLTTSAYPSLEGAPVDIFGWTSGSPRTIEGSLAKPNIGDIGTAGSDKCFLVLQVRAAPGVALLSNTETVTLGHTDDSTAMLKTASIQGLAW